MTWFTQHLTSLGARIAHPFTFVAVIVYTALWLIFDRQSFDWHAVATLATWMMTLVIQRSGHRDMQAVHAKLDELLRSHPDAKSELARLDDEEPETVEKYRRQNSEK